MSVRIKPIKEGRREPIILKSDVLEDIYDVVALMRILDVVNKERDKLLVDLMRARNNDKKTYYRQLLDQLRDDAMRQSNKIQQIIDKYD